MRALSLMLALGVSAGVATAQPPAAGSADPAAAGSAAAAAPAPAAPPAAPAEPPNAAGLRQTCVDAMNAAGNEAFARSIIQTAISKELVYVKAMCEGQDTIKAHQDAVAHVEKNERHVIAAYAAIWVISALFLLYLLRRQQRLRAEIGQLRRDLDAATKDGKGEK